ncbi:MAG: hypothetical protein ACYCVD_16885 [Desulfitobacteriaceae bacterium]
MIEDGLYSLIKTNIPDFNGTNEYQMYYLAVFDPVPPPYCVFRRYRRELEMDLSSNYRLFISSYVLEIYHNDSWALLDLQKRIRSLLEGLPLTTVGGIFVQGLAVQDDFHTIPPLMQEVRTRVFTGVLDFEVIHHPD